MQTPKGVVGLEDPTLGRLNQNSQVVVNGLVQPGAYKLLVQPTLILQLAV